MADEKKADRKGIVEGEVHAPPIVQSTTEVVSNEGSKTSVNNKLETEAAPPLSTNEPNVPIAHSLAAGAGEHTPPDPKEFDSQGRPRDVSGISQEDEGK